LTEAHALAAAFAAMARLDEYTRHFRNPEIARAWFARSETLAVMQASEGELLQETTLCHLLIDDLYELSTLKQRLAPCIHSAILRSIAGPDNEEDPLDWIAGVWGESESSNRHRDVGAAQWRHEASVHEILAPIRSALSTPTPEVVAECIRQIWVGNAFDGRGKRMALLLAPFLIRRAFKSPLAQCGLARALARDADHTNEAVEDAEAWLLHFYAAVEESAVRAYEALNTLARVKADLSALLPRERGTSRSGPTIELFLQRPIQTAQDIAGAIGSSDFGARLIIDKLIKAGVITPLDGSRQNRSYICRKAMAA